MGGPGSGRRRKSNPLTTKPDRGICPEKTSLNSYGGGDFGSLSVVIEVGDDTGGSRHNRNTRSAARALAKPDQDARTTIKNVNRWKMAGQSMASDVKLSAPLESGEAYACNDSPQKAASNHGEDALANLMTSMEQFVAESSSASHNTNSEAIEQEIEARDLHQSQHASVTDDIMDTIICSPKPSNVIPTKRAQRNQSKQQSVKKAKKDIWSAENVLQNPKSPLVDANLKGVFANPEAWNVLDEETKKKLISMLPESKHVLDEIDGESRISENFLKYDQNWSHYLGRAQEDIAEGRNDPVWLEQAVAASEQRAAGEFDDWKDNEYELFWGIKQKLASNVLAGLATHIKFDDLITRELVKPGDIFLFQRKVGGFFIEKEIKFVETQNSGSKRVIKCSVPPGASKFSKGDEDIIKSEVSGPESLCRVAIEVDGRLKGKPPNGNAWKTIRVLRNNQDLGTLWDIRQALHFSLPEGDD